MFTTSLDLRATEPGEWELLAPLKWAGVASITVPAGFITDLASLPRLVRPVLDRNGLSRRAAVLHDWLYCLKTGGRADADKLFLEALKTEGVGWAARWSMYTGVRAGGWVYWHRRQGLELDDFVGG